MSPHDVILRPVMSEKAFAFAALEEGSRKYAFYVHPKANRTVAKEAIEKVFNVEVIKINVLNVQGKKKTQGRFTGRRPQRRKVIVTLRAGQRIAQLDGMMEGA
ncbi:MAG: 50S ribosomal protein L23 [Deinococcales bacterium]